MSLLARLSLLFNPITTNQRSIRISLFYLNPPVLSIGSFNKECAYEKAMQNPGEYIRLFTRDESDIYDPNVEGIELGAVELTRNDNFMYSDEEKQQRYLFIKEGDGFRLYKRLASVKESNIYHWKERPRYRAHHRRKLWAQVSTPLARFNITYGFDYDSVNISIAIGHGIVEYKNIMQDATNEKITKLINDYIEDFKKKANEMPVIVESTNDD